MGKRIEPQVFLIGETRLNNDGIAAFLEHLKVPDEWHSDASTEIEHLTEIYGRLCYMSFGTELNPNITRVRKRSKDYLANIIEKGDGSVLEHCMLNFVFADVSRVFTHELVTHRVGTAKSQTSLRFVRLTDLNWYAPTCIQESPEAMIIFSKTMEQLSQLQVELAEVLKIDEQTSFDKKKELTSAMRRLAPDGLATNIGWSCNLRTLRHVIEQRTAPWAEEEMRLVFNKVAEIAVKRWPNLFGDYTTELVNGFRWYKTVSKKV